MIPVRERWQTISKLKQYKHKPLIFVTMFSKVIPRIKEFYFLPIAYFLPMKVFSGGYEECINNKNETVTKTTLRCVMGAWAGVFEGVFLGIVWPITIPIMIAKKYNDKH
jgi:hypothetical protein